MVNPTGILVIGALGFGAFYLYKKASHGGSQLTPVDPDNFGRPTVGGGTHGGIRPYCQFNCSQWNHNIDNSKTLPIYNSLNTSGQSVSKDTYLSGLDILDTTASHNVHVGNGNWRSGGR